MEQPDLKVQRARYEEVLQKIRDIGYFVGGPAGMKLASCVPGGDYRDLLKFLGKANADVAAIEALLSERESLSQMIGVFGNTSVISPRIWNL
jgi:hypothetical protein